MPDRTESWAGSGAIVRAERSCGMQMPEGSEFLRIAGEEPGFVVLQRMGGGREAGEAERSAACGARPRTVPPTPHDPRRRGVRGRERGGEEVKEGGGEGEGSTAAGAEGAGAHRHEGRRLLTGASHGPAVPGLPRNTPTEPAEPGSDGERDWSRDWTRLVTSWAGS